MNRTRFELKLLRLATPCLEFSTLGKSVFSMHAVLPNAQPPPVAFTVLAQLRGPKANDTEMSTALFTENGAGRNFAFNLKLNSEGLF